MPGYEESMEGRNKKKTDAIQAVQAARELTHFANVGMQQVTMFFNQVSSLLNTDLSKLEDEVIDKVKEFVGFTGHLREDFIKLSRELKTFLDETTRVMEEEVPTQALNLGQVVALARSDLEEYSDYPVSYVLPVQVDYNTKNTYPAKFFLSLYDTDENRVKAYLSRLTGHDLTIEQRRKCRPCLLKATKGATREFYQIACEDSTEIEFVIRLNLLARCLAWVYEGEDSTIASVVRHLSAYEALEGYTPSSAMSGTFNESIFNSLPKQYRERLCTNLQELIAMFLKNPVAAFPLVAGWEDLCLLKEMLKKYSDSGLFEKKAKTADQKKLMGAMPGMAPGAAAAAGGGGASSSRQKKDVVAASVPSKLTLSELIEEQALAFFKRLSTLADLELVSLGEGVTKKIEVLQELAEDIYPDCYGLKWELVRLLDAVPQFTEKKVSAQALNLGQVVALACSNLEEYSDYSVSYVLTAQVDYSTKYTYPAKFFLSLHDTNQKRVKVYLSGLTGHDLTIEQRRKCRPCLLKATKGATREFYQIACEDSTEIEFVIRLNLLARCLAWVYEGEGSTIASVVRRLSAYEALEGYTPSSEMPETFNELIFNSLPKQYRKCLCTNLQELIARLLKNPAAAFPPAEGWEDLCLLKEMLKDYSDSGLFEKKAKTADQKKLMGAMPGMAPGAAAAAVGGGASSSRQRDSAARSAPSGAGAVVSGGRKRPKKRERPDGGASSSLSARLFQKPTGAAALGEGMPAGVAGAAARKTRRRKGP